MFSNVCLILTFILLHNYLFLRSPKILLGLTGSVATIKAAVIVDEIKSKLENAEIIVILTEHATHFLPENFSTLDVKIYRDQDEWDSWTKRGDPVLRELISFHLPK